MSIHKTIEAAKAAVRDSYDHAKERFCPLVNGYCEPHCLCFRNGSISHVKMIDGTTEYKAIITRCTNRMFFGRDKANE